MRRIVFVVSLLFAFPIGLAEAAPQILGLFATGPTPTQLHCKDGVCSARFSAFCLQQQRDAPLSGQAYVPADGTELHLVVTDKDGYQRMVPGEGLTIRSASHYTSVMISIDEAAVRALGGETVALVVPARATLLPESMATDPNPQTVAEIEQAVGQHRRIGESMRRAESIKKRLSTSGADAIEVAGAGETDEASSVSGDKARRAEIFLKK